MTPEQQKVVEEMRSEGYAMAIFTPDELRGADADQVEDLMVERGWQAIDTLGD